MPWGFAIGAAATLGTAYLSGEAADKAANKQANAANAANATQLAMYRQSRSDLAPYRQSGYNALNALNRAMGLPTVGMDSPDMLEGSSGHSLYGDGNVPLTREGLMQAYRDVLGREPDQAGVDFYMSAGQRGASAGNIKTGIANAVGGPLSKVANSVWGDKAPQGPVTFNEFLNYTLNSDEYKEKTASGQLDPWSQERRNAIFSPQTESQEFIGGSETNPDDRYGGFYESPGFRFARDEALKGAERAASAGGYVPTGDGGLSGRFSKEMSRYSQGLASQEFGNYINRLAGISGTGQTATNDTATLGANYATNSGNLMVRAGDARASGIIGRSNAYAEGMEGIAGLAGQYYGIKT